LEARNVFIADTPLPDIAEYAIADALAFFQGLELTGQKAQIAEKILKEVCDRLGFLVNVGLNYLNLSRAAGTLSGGEAQRIKLATELSKRDTGNTFYILDEPTTGLHFEDIRVLMIVLNKLADKGNTVLIIEHNLDVIKTVDHIIDIGYEGGKGGGQIIVEGTPEEVAKHPKSYTAKFLRKELN